MSLEPFSSAGQMVSSYCKRNQLKIQVNLSWWHLVKTHQCPDDVHLLGARSSLSSSSSLTPSFFPYVLFNSVQRHLPSFHLTRLTSSPPSHLHHESKLPGRLDLFFNYLAFVFIFSKNDASYATLKSP